MIFFPSHLDHDHRRPDFTQLSLLTLRISDLFPRSQFRSHISCHHPSHMARVQSTPPDFNTACHKDLLQVALPVSDTTTRLPDDNFGSHFPSHHPSHTAHVLLPASTLLVTRTFYKLRSLYRIPQHVSRMTTLEATFLLITYHTWHTYSSRLQHCLSQGPFCEIRKLARQTTPSIPHILRKFDTLKVSSQLCLVIDPPIITILQCHTHSTSYQALPLTFSLPCMSRPSTVLTQATVYKAPRPPARFPSQPTILQRALLFNPLPTRPTSRPYFANGRNAYSHFKQPRRGPSPQASRHPKKYWQRHVHDVLCAITTAGET